MPAREAEAIVLRQYALAEADRIVVFLTREWGTLRAVVRGAKKLSSRMGSCIEPLNHVRLQFYAKEGAELARIWHCETVHSYLGRNPTLDRLFGFSYLAELVQELVPENNPNPLLFRLFLAILEAGKSLGGTLLLLRYFEIWALRINGWLPDYDYCSGCGICVKDDGFYAWLESGQARCRSCAENRGMRIGSEAARLLRDVIAQPPARFAGTAASAAALHDLEHLTQRSVEYHLEKKLKSYSALREFLRSS